jgi:hypothetical protein
MAGRSRHGAPDRNTQTMPLRLPEPATYHFKLPEASRHQDDRPFDHHRSVGTAVIVRSRVSGTRQGRLTIEAILLIRGRPCSMHGPRPDVGQHRLKSKEPIEQRSLA